MGDDNWKRLSKFLSEDTIDGIVSSLSKLISYQKKIFSIVLHGGEPFLLGKKKLAYLLSRLRSALPTAYPISLQTNGILISKELLDICSEYRVSVAVSIDGPEEVHNRNRVSRSDYGTFSDVIAGIRILKEHKDSSFLDAGLLAVIDPSSDPGEVYRFFKSIKAPSVDFLYRDGNHSKLPIGKSDRNSTEFGSWMVGLLKVYLEDESPLPIRVLDDMLKVLLGGNVSKEGLGVTDFAIIIIDTDGTIMKNDTLKSSFNGADRFNTSTNIGSGNLIDFINSDEFAEYRELQRPTSVKCLACPVLNVCGGGMILHRYYEGNGFNNSSVYCADQLFLIENMKDNLQNLLNGTEHG